MPSIDVANADLLLTTTKQVHPGAASTWASRRAEVLLECIDVASRADGRQPSTNPWMIIDDPATKAEIAPRHQSVGRPYLAAGGSRRATWTPSRVVDSARSSWSASPSAAWVLAIQLDFPTPDGLRAPTWPVPRRRLPVSGAPGSPRRGLARRGPFHLVHEQGVRGDPRHPQTVTQVALLPVAFCTGDSFHHLATLGAPPTRSCAYQQLEGAGRRSLNASVSRRGDRPADEGRCRGRAADDGHEGVGHGAEDPLRHGGRPPISRRMIRILATSRRRPCRGDGALAPATSPSVVGAESIFNARNRGIPSPLANQLRRCVASLGKRNKEKGKRGESRLCETSGPPLALLESPTDINE